MAAKVPGLGGLGGGLAGEGLEGIDRTGVVVTQMKGLYTLIKDM